MSIDQSLIDEKLNARNWLGLIYQNQIHVRKFRFAVGVTLSVALAYVWH